MNIPLRRLIVSGFLLAGVFGATTDAQQESTAPQDLDAIRAAVRSYEEAFNQKNAGLVAAHWSAEGVYLNDSSGEETVGRQAIQANLEKVFSSAEAPKLSLQTESIDLVSPNVALERGTSTIVFSDEQAEQSQYKVVYVKRDGKWLIDRVTETSELQEENHYDELQQLEALTGSWVFENDRVRVEKDYQWTTRKNFLSLRFKVLEDEEVTSSGLQIIGWDAREQKIKSWLFDSDGGVVQGTWTNHNDGWSIQNTATLAEGESGSYTTILEPVDDDRFTWRKVNRIVEGKLLPNIEAVTFERR